MSKTSVHDEQRTYPRIPKEALVTVTKLEYPMPIDAESTGVLKNIAGSGIRLTTTSYYETGTRLSVNINLKGWRRHLKSVASIIDDSATVTTTPLTVVAEVVWVTSLPDGQNYEDEYNALKKYLENLADYSVAR